jgi:hypothetical protein
MGRHYRTRLYGGESGPDCRLWDRRLWDLRRLVSVERGRRRHRRRVSGRQRTSQYGVCGGYDPDRRRDRAPNVDEPNHNAHLPRHHRTSHSARGSRREICPAGWISLSCSWVFRAGAWLRRCHALFVRQPRNQLGELLRQIRSDCCDILLLQSLDTITYQLGLPQVGLDHRVGHPIPFDLAHCSAWRTKGRRWYVNGFQYGGKHRSGLLPEKPLRCRRSVRAFEQEVVNGRQAFTLPGIIESA